MKRLFWILGCLIIAAAIGVSIQRYPGVIVVALSEWRIDIPLWFGVLFCIVFYLCFHWLTQFFNSILQVARSLAHFGRHYRKHRAKALTRKGLMAFTEGNYAVAEKALEQSAEDSEVPWYTYFTAAKAAQALGDESRAAHYLARVQALAPDSELAVSLAQAQYHIKKKEYEKAIAILLPLEVKTPNHSLVLEGLYECYDSLGHWEKLSSLLPKLLKNHIISREYYQTLEHKVWEKRFTNKASLAENQALWKALPSTLHTDKDIVLLYAKCLIAHKQWQEAELILKNAIKYEWNEELVKCYGNLSHANPQKLLNTAEGWLQVHFESPGLLLALGRLCVQQELWGKAQRYYEASLSLEATPQVYAELAALLEKMNKPDLSAQYFKKGLLLAMPVATE